MVEAEELQLVVAEDSFIRIIFKCKMTMVMKMTWMTMECTTQKRTQMTWSHSMQDKIIHLALCSKVKIKCLVTLWAWVWVEVLVLQVVYHSMVNKINNL